MLFDSLKCWGKYVKKPLHNASLSRTILICDSCRIVSLLPPPVFITRYRMRAAPATCNSLLKSLLILITNFFLLETELDSLLRGELVRVLPMRQHRHSQVIITAPMTTQTTTNSLSSAAPTVR